jgi:hypothetical protein
MKSTMAWLDLGDDNIKFFHRFTNHKNCINTIWEMKDYEDHNVRGFKILVYLGVQHISKIYKELEVTNDENIVKVFYYFPFLVSREDGFIKKFIPFKH